jgi:hypothetical protein
MRVALLLPLPLRERVGVKGLAARCFVLTPASPIPQPQREGESHATSEPTR